jgi:hypothetical protein
MQFFKAYWDLLKEPIYRMMTAFHAGAKFEQGCNPSFIALIAKSNEPGDLNGYRPIALMSSIYKIIAKVLVARLSPLLDHVISEFQSAFVKGRHILDGPLIVSEILSWARKRKVKTMLFKIDFEKAYDSVNWKFLAKAMSYMGFPDTWIGWIMNCISSGRGSILVNGSPTKEFSFKRGLRQGDPLSPALFLIVMEVLSKLLNKAVASGDFKGTKISIDGPTISHLIYADDVMIIGEWSKENIIIINRLLRIFNLISGLKINIGKCKLFGIGIESNEVSRLAREIGCDAGVFPFTYLGLPIGANMNTVQAWKPVIDRLQNKLSSWKAKTLSFAGRITLAKSVLGNLPSYYLSLFKAPKRVLSILEGLRRSFVWGDVDGKGKINWIKWDKLSRPKEFGGLGIGNLQDVNYTMLGKWVWRFYARPDLLWVSVITAIHGRPPDGYDGRFFPIRSRWNGIWKHIGDAKKVLENSGLDFAELIDSHPNFYPTKEMKLHMVARRSVYSDAGRIRWNSVAPPKANLLIWRAKHDAVASRWALARRGIPLNSISCTRCLAHSEDSDHIFINCLWARAVWWSIARWIRIEPFDLNSIGDVEDYFMEQIGSNRWKKVIHLIFIAACWNLWVARNKLIFEDKRTSVASLLESIKMDAYFWICNRSKYRPIGWDEWCNFDVLNMV